MGDWGLGIGHRAWRRDKEEGGDKGEIYLIIPSCASCPPHLPTPLSNRVTLTPFWTGQCSRVSNFFKFDKNIVTVTAIVADGRCHPN